MTTALDHLLGNDGYRPAGVDDRRERRTIRRRSDSDDGTKNGPGQFPATFAEVGVRVDPGLSQVRRRVVRRGRALARLRRPRCARARYLRATQTAMPHRNERCRPSRPPPTGLPRLRAEGSLPQGLMVVRMTCLNTYSWSGDGDARSSTGNAGQASSRPRLILPRGHREGMSDYRRPSCLRAGLSC